MACAQHYQKARLVGRGRRDRHQSNISHQKKERFNNDRLLIKEFNESLTPLLNTTGLFRNNFTEVAAKIYSFNSSAHTLSVNSTLASYSLGFSP